MQDEVAVQDIVNSKDTTVDDEQMPLDGYTQR